MVSHTQTSVCLHIKDFWMVFFFEQFAINNVVCQSQLQVKHASHQRGGDVGVPLTSAEQVVDNTCYDFWAKYRVAKAGAGAKAVVETVKRQVRVDGSAAYDLSRLIQNALMALRGKGLEVHIAADRPFDDDLGVGEVLTPGIVVCWDEEQVQWQLLKILQKVLRVSIIGFLDGYHRRNNDLWSALAKCGFSSYCILAMIAMNVWHAPWNSCAFFRNAKDLTQDMVVRAKPDSPVLRHFWQRICKDRGDTTSEATGSDARRRFVQKVAGEKVFNNIGAKCSPSKFCSVPMAFRSIKKDWHVKAYGLCEYSVWEGWSKGLHDHITLSQRVGCSGSTSSCKEVVLGASYFRCLSSWYTNRKKTIPIVKHFFCFETYRIHDLRPRIFQSSGVFWGFYPVLRFVYHW